MKLRFVILKILLVLSLNIRNRITLYLLDALKLRFLVFLQSLALSSDILANELFALCRFGPDLVNLVIG